MEVGTPADTCTAIQNWIQRTLENLKAAAKNTHEHTLAL